MKGGDTQIVVSSGELCPGNQTWWTCAAVRYGARTDVRGRMIDGTVCVAVIGCKVRTACRSLFPPGLPMHTNPSPTTRRLRRPSHPAGLSQAVVYALLHFARPLCSSHAAAHRSDCVRTRNTPLAHTAAAARLRTAAPGRLHAAEAPHPSGDLHTALALASLTRTRSPCDGEPCHAENARRAHG